MAFSHSTNGLIARIATSRAWEPLPATSRDPPDSHVECGDRGLLDPVHPDQRAQGLLRDFPRRSTRGGHLDVSHPLQGVRRAAPGNPVGGCGRHPTRRSRSSPSKSRSTLATTAPRAGNPVGYAFLGNTVVLYPVPSGSPALSLRFYFQNRPSELVAEEDCIRITSSGGAPPAGPHRLRRHGPEQLTRHRLGGLGSERSRLDVLYTGAISAIVAATYVELPGPSRPLAVATGCASRTPRPS